MAYTSVPCLPPDGAGERKLANEWEMAHATAAMAGANVEHLPVDAADYGVLQGIEHHLDAHDGPSHAAANHYWLQAIMEAASRSGAGVLLTGQMGNATVSWSGNGSALALRLFLHAEPNPWLTLKRQLLKPLLMPGLLAFRRFKTPPSSSWRDYSALSPSMASKLDLDTRMQAAGHDPAFTFSPLKDLHLLFFQPDFGIGAGLGAELAARHSLASLDPTADLAMVEFLLRVPDDQFYRGGQSSFLMRRAFRNRLPDPVLNGQRKGLQAADVGHRILRELPAFQQCLSALDSLPEAQEILDMPLLHRCLDDLIAKVDPETTARASSILLRGLGVGLFLRRLADSRS
jgi:asparagine synthase (glutamine-hydrolysing)